VENAKPVEHQNPDTSETKLISENALYQSTDAGLVDNELYVSS